MYIQEVLKMINLNFNFVRGDTFEKIINVSWNKTITGIYFTVKKEEKAKDYVLQKKLNSGITKTSEEEGKTSFLLTIDATDTDNFETNYDYLCDIEVLSNGIKKTIAKGTLNLTTDITTTENEV